MKAILKRALTLARFISIDNWIAGGLVGVVAAWSLIDIFVPVDLNPLPDFSLQVGLSITVSAIAASLLLLQARQRQDSRRVADSALVTAEVSTKLDDLDKRVDGYARRAEEFSRRDAPNQVDGPLIKTELEALLASDELQSWKFRGGSGRWQRQRVLPELAKIRDRDVTYKMLILDPREDSLCRLYARYRNSHRHDGGQETVETIRLQMSACIVSAVWHATRSRVSPEIRLGQTYSPLRLDIGNAGAMVTVSDPKQPALLASGTSWFYRSLDDELERAAERSPLVIFDHLVDRLSGETTLTTELVGDILKAVTVRAPGGEGEQPLFTSVQVEALDLASLLDLVVPRPSVEEVTHIA